MAITFHGGIDGKILNLRKGIAVETARPAEFLRSLGLLAVERKTKSVLLRALETARKTLVD